MKEDGKVKQEVEQEIKDGAESPSLTSLLSLLSLPLSSLTTFVVTALAKCPHAVPETSTPPARPHLPLQNSNQSRRSLLSR
jgi:hypothetical protein